MPEAVSDPATPCRRERERDETDAKFLAIVRAIPRKHWPLLRRALIRIGNGGNAEQAIGRFFAESRIDRLALALAIERADLARRDCRAPGDPLPARPPAMPKPPAYPLKPPRRKPKPPPAPNPQAGA